MGSNLSFKDAVKICFSKFATISGRARRSEYWYFSLFKFITLTTLYLVAAVVSFVASLDLTVVFWSISLALLIPSITVHIRRLHDTGRSGWNILWCLLPFIGSVVLLIFLVQDSMSSTNKWGPDPKARTFLSQQNYVSQ